MIFLAKGFLFGDFDMLRKPKGRTPSSNKLRSSAAGKHILSAAAKKFGLKASDTCNSFLLSLGI